MKIAINAKQVITLILSTIFIFVSILSYAHKLHHHESNHQNDNDQHQCLICNIIKNHNFILPNDNEFKSKSTNTSFILNNINYCLNNYAEVFLKIRAPPITNN